jgi:FAD/FMN-containing dehydrogenase
MAELSEQSSVRTTNEGLVGADDGDRPELTETAVSDFKALLRGTVLRPGDAGYNEARKVWNGMIDRTPALIVRCAGVADVIASVHFARTHTMLVSVRGGGHNVTGNAVCDGGMVIDLSPMKGIQVDPERRTARAQAGVLWSELDHETQAFGLATNGGTISHTGIAGLTLGGGVGWLMRRYGLTVDNLLSVDVVTADGRLVKASATENEDLFWGLRGGGGNFGIATSFEYQLHPVGPIVIGGLAMYPAEKAGEVLRFFREFTASAPDELTTYAIFLTAPPAPFVPPELVGQKMVALAVCHCGSLEQGEQAVQPLREFMQPVVDMIGPIPYVIVQKMFDEGTAHGFQVYLKSDNLASLDDEVLDTIVAQAAGVTSPLSVVLVFPLSGAVSRVPVEATAFSHRKAAYDYVVYSIWVDPAESERHIAWTREFASAMHPYSVGVYVNEMGDEGEDRVRAAYGNDTYSRLVALKNTYDPTNFFCMNQNIKPTL